MFSLKFTNLKNLKKFYQNYVHIFQNSFPTFLFSFAQFSRKIYPTHFAKITKTSETSPTGLPHQNKWHFFTLHSLSFILFFLAHQCIIFVVVFVDALCCSSPLSPSHCLPPLLLVLSSIHSLPLLPLFFGLFFLLHSFIASPSSLLWSLFSPPFIHCLSFLSSLFPFSLIHLSFVSFPLPLIPLFHWLPPFPLIHSLIVSPSYFSLDCLSASPSSLSLAPFPFIHLSFVSTSYFSFLSLSSIPKTFFLLFLWVPSLIHKNFFILSFSRFTIFLLSLFLQFLTLLLHSPIISPIIYLSFLMLLVFLEGFAASLFFISSSKG